MDIFGSSQSRHRASFSYLALMILQFLQQTCVAAGGEIQLAPESITIALGSSVTFTCVAIGENTKWVVNGETFESGNHTDEFGFGYLFNEIQTTDETGGRNHIHNMTLTFDANMDKNRTTVHCVAIKDSAVFSPPAVLTIMGPPSPPVPRLHFVNRTRLTLEWNSPFTWPEYPIHHYDIDTHNVQNRPEWHEDGYTGTSKTFEKAPDMQECKEYVFSVRANNQLGDSERGEISGGFPIVPQRVKNPIAVEVQFSRELVPTVKLNISLPRVCGFQEIEYTVTLQEHKSTGSLTLTHGPHTQSYGESPYISVTFNSNELKPHLRYTVLATFQTHAESDVEISMPIVESRTIVTSIKQPTEDALTDSNNILGTQQIIIISVVGGAVLLIVAVIMAIMIMLCARAQQRRRIYSHARSSNNNSSIKRPPMVTNPIYEGPLYESIAEPKFNRLHSMQSDHGTNSLPPTPSHLITESPYAGANIDPAYAMPNNNFPNLPPNNDDSYQIMSAAGIAVGKSISDDEGESNLDRPRSPDIRYTTEPGVNIVTEC